MSELSHNNHNRISGYLDTLLVDNALWDEKLSLAMNPPARPMDTITEGKCLLVTSPFGSGNRSQKYLHFLKGLSLVRELPASRVKTNILDLCLPLMAEAMPCD
jgi:hypothetical protein